MIEIADWVMTAHHDVPPENTRIYQDLRHKLLSYVKEMGMADCYQMDDGEYFETKEYEDNAEQYSFIEAYPNFVTQI
jgi:hypothetical protein